MHQLYGIIHITGIFMVFLAYGGLIVRSAIGSENKDIRRMGAITSGIGLILILIGGFGLQARLNYGWPLWILVKISVWFILGFLLVLINRKPQLSQILWWSTIILGLVALLMAVLKPTF